MQKKRDARWGAFSLSTTAEDIRSGLHQVRDFEGVTGSCNIDEDGMVVKKYQLTILKNGKWVPYEK